MQTRSEKIRIVDKRKQDEGKKVDKLLVRFLQQTPTVTEVLLPVYIKYPAQRIRNLCARARTKLIDSAVRRSTICDYWVYTLS